MHEVSVCGWIQHIGHLIAVNRTITPCLPVCLCGHFGAVYSWLRHTIFTIIWSFLSYKRPQLDTMMFIKRLTFTTTSHTPTANQCLVFSPGPADKHSYLVCLCT